jgi:hypothetical protein
MDRGLCSLLALLSALSTAIAVPDKGRFCRREVAKDVLGVRGECDLAYNDFRYSSNARFCWSASAVP